LTIIIVQWSDLSFVCQVSFPSSPSESCDATSYELWLCLAIKSWKTGDTTVYVSGHTGVYVAFDYIEYLETSCSCPASWFAPNWVLNSFVLSLWLKLWQPFRCSFQLVHTISTKDQASFVSSEIWFFPNYQTSYLVGYFISTYCICH